MESVIVRSQTENNDKSLNNSLSALFVSSTDMANGKGLPAVHDDEQEASRARTIVIVEDNEMILESIVDHIADYGFKAYGMHDYHEFYSNLPKIHPDTLLLDHFLPNKTGAEITQELTEQQIPDDTLVILMSAHQNVRTIAEELGVPFLEKPFHMNDLINLMKKRRNLIIPKRKKSLLPQNKRAKKEPSTSTVINDLKAFFLTFPL